MGMVFEGRSRAGMGGVTKVGRTLVNKQEGSPKRRGKDSKKKKCLLF